MSISAVMQRILIWGGMLALAVAVIGGTIGWLVAGGAGLTSAVVGTAVAIAFCLLTAVSVIVGLRISKGEVLSVGFFGVLLGGLVLKFVLFFMLLLWIRDQPWLHPGIAFGTIVAAVLGSLVVESIVVAKSRMPYVDDMPEDETQGRPARR